MVDRTMDKAVILAGGLGTRMQRADDTAGLSADEREAADAGLKAMIPIDRPFLDYALAALADAGFLRACIVVGPTHDQVRDYYGSLATERIGIDFAVQAEPRGTADALRAAESFANDDDVAVFNCDNYYGIDALRSLRTELTGSGLVAFSREGMIAGGQIAPDRISKFAVVQTDDAGRLVRIVEKPDEATLAAMGPPILVSMNCWRFGPAIFEACRKIGPSKRNEFELTDAVQYAIDQLGEPFGVVASDYAVLDLSAKVDIAFAKTQLAGKEVRL